MRKEEALNLPQNNHTPEMIRQWEDRLPEGYEIFWSDKADGWAFRKRGTKHPCVEIWDDGTLSYTGSATKYPFFWKETQIEEAIRYVWG